ncbi:MAG: hypothetical protein IT514_04675 [Burkholderiales bacterium]|nr:hypothetical protein [Burkholderiales bacterium]
MKLKGWYAAVFAEFEDGRRFALHFVDTTRLRQDVEQAVAEGRACIAEAGMVVVSEVTLDNMQRAFGELAERRFFQTLVPLTDDEFGKIYRIIGDFSKH